MAAGLQIWIIIKPKAESPRIVRLVLRRMYHSSFSVRTHLLEFFVKFLVLNRWFACVRFALWFRDLVDGTSAGKSVTESFKFCFHEFISVFSARELQWRTASESGFRLGQPDVGFSFAAKDELGMMLNQLDMIHFLTLLRLVGVRSVSSDSQ